MPHDERMPRIPTVLGPSDLPSPELFAARLDGELMQLHGGFVPIDEPDVPALRAHILALGADRTLILERRCAAWVHGAVAAPPRERQFCTSVTARTGRRSGTWRVREVMLEAGEVVEFATVRCTSRGRTAFDLLREPDEPSDEPADEVELIVARLLADHHELAAALIDRLARSPRLPFRALASARLRRVLAAAPQGAGLTAHPAADQPSADQPSATR
jgi:hypothetical protein